MAIASSLIKPIWKYFAETFSGATTQRFRVRIADDESDAADETAGTIIYEGVGVAAVGASDVVVGLNDILADYLSAPFQLATGGRWYTQERLGCWFGIDQCDADGVTWGNTSYYFVYSDWSYDYDFAPATMTLAHPVTGVVAPNQWLVVSFIDVDAAGDVDFTITNADGTTQTISVYLGVYEDFNDDFNNDFAVEQQDAAEAGYAALYLGTYPDAVSVVATCGGITSPVYSVRQDTCKRYCLYYRNAYGGYDSLLLDSVKRLESYARSTISRWVDNATQGIRAKDTYRNGITEGWQMRVAGLTDAQAEWMQQLTGSADVYLCDLNTDTLTPLVLTDAQAEDKTFRNQNRRRLEWVLNAETAQDFERR